MGIEIERKFLVKNDAWRGQVESQVHIMQGYLANNAGLTVRARVKGERAYLTIKGPTQGVSRAEYEYEIPVEDAETMLRELAISPPIDKVRHKIRVGDHVWELDVFAGENAGLVMAEVELESEDETFVLPDWAGEDVSADPRYYNVNLARNPFKHW
jgi:adenylate cyclase